MLVYQGIYDSLGMLVYQGIYGCLGMLVYQGINGCLGMLCYQVIYGCLGGMTNCPKTPSGKAGLVSDDVGAPANIGLSRGPVLFVDRGRSADGYYLAVIRHSLSPNSELSADG
jgi:hypothetical protein